jgi:hypothetical protein
MSGIPWLGAQAGLALDHRSLRSKPLMHFPYGWICRP